MGDEPRGQRAEEPSSANVMRAGVYSTPALASAWTRAGGPGTEHGVAYDREHDDQGGLPRQPLHNERLLQLRQTGTSLLVLHRGRQTRFSVCAVHEPGQRHFAGPVDLAARNHGLPDCCSIKRRGTAEF